VTTLEPVAGQEGRAGAPLYGLIFGVVLQLIAGGIAFLTDVPLVGLVLFIVGIVCIGACGEALTRPDRRSALELSGGRRGAGRS
jgi:hypothetical protein